MAKTNNTEHLPSNKSLSIQINLSGLSFCVLNQSSNTIETIGHNLFAKPKTIEELLDAVKHEFNNNTLLNQNFDSVVVVHQNNWQTIVPKAVFNEDHLTDYLKFNTKILANDFLAYDTVDALDINVVYVPFQNINNYLIDKFGHFTYKHSCTVLLDVLSKTEKNKQEKTVYLNIESDNFNLVVFDSGKLILNNCFEYTTSQDFIYYVLFSFEQLQLNPEQVKTFFTGKVTEQDELFKQAYTYIRHVDIFKPNYNFEFENKPLQEHYHFNLIKAL